MLVKYQCAPLTMTEHAKGQHLCSRMQANDMTQTMKENNLEALRTNMDILNAGLAHYLGHGLNNRLKVSYSDANFSIHD